MHFFYCWIIKRYLSQTPGPPSEAIPFLLRTLKGAAILAAWLLETYFYNTIYPRQPLL
jgi:hypothetical protein